MEPVPVPGPDDAEAGVGLLVAVVLVAAHGVQHGLLQGPMGCGHGIGDGERVTVEEHDQIVGPGFGHDHRGQQIELAGMSAPGRDHLVELAVVVAGDGLQVGDHPIRLVHVPAEVGELDIDPLVGAVVDGGYVDHRLCPLDDKEYCICRSSLTLCRRGDPSIERGEVADTDDDQDGKTEGHRTVAECQATDTVRLAQPIRDRRSEGPGQDVGEPEGEDGVHAEEPVSRGRDDHESGKEDCGDQVAEMKGGCSQIPQCRAHGKGGHHGGPVEGLAAGAVDAVDRQGPLGPVPGDEHHGQDGGEQRRGGGVGHPELDVEDVGGHGSCDRNHHDRQPVGPGHIARARNWRISVATRQTPPRLTATTGSMRLTR